MVESILNYELLVWAGTHVENATFNKLCHLQNKIIFNLLASNTDNTENINLIYKGHDILNCLISTN